MSDRQNELMSNLIGLARAVVGNEDLVSEDTLSAVVDGLFAVLTSMNCDEVDLSAMIERVRNEKKKLVPNCFTCIASCGRTEIYDMQTLWKADKEHRNLKVLLLFGILGMSVYAHRLSGLRHQDDDRYHFLYKALFAIGMDDWGREELLPIMMEFGERQLKYMEIFDQRTETQK